MPWRLDARTLRDSPNLTLQTDAGPIDLLGQVAGLGSYPEVLASAITLRLEEMEIAVLDLPGLMKAKQAAGRAKDAAVLPLIESTLLLREQSQQRPAHEPPDAAGMEHIP